MERRNRRRFEIEEVDIESVKDSDEEKKMCFFFSILQRNDIMSYIIKIIGIQYS